MLGPLQSLFTKIGSVFRQVLGLIIPFVTQARDYQGWSTGLRWAVRIVLLVGITVALWWANRYFGVDRWITPSVLRRIGLQHYFLPILFLLACALCWLGWLLWKLLGPEEEAAEFPDVAAAWDEAVAALNQGGIDLTEVPLFLVVGKPTGGEEALFNAAQLPLTVKHAPQRPDAPLHVYGNRDGVYITCAGASLLGRQAAILAGESASSLPGDGAGFAPSVEGGGEEDPYKTLPPKGQLKNVQAILARAKEQGREPHQLTDAEKEEIRTLLAEDKSEGAQGAAKARPNLLKNSAEVEWLTARLKYLCRLIVRDRHPYCPLNGVLLLVPFAGADSEEDANQTGLICQQELATLRQAMQVHCPLFALACDLETAAGFREFITRFPADQRQRRLGQRFPLMPDLNPGESIPELADRGAQWITTSLLPSWIYKLFRLETPGKEELATVVGGNIRLYQLLNQMRERRKRLGRILTRALTTQQSGPLLFGGCYIAGTGKDAAREQAFVAGVFRRLIENQNFVSWTAEAAREETDYEQWTRYGYVGIGMVAVGLLTFIGFTFFSRS